MQTLEPMDALDRHALVIAGWLAAGLVAATLLHHGLAGGGGAWIIGGFLAIAAGYAGHLIVNVLTGTRFTSRELALGLVLYLLGLVACVMTALVRPRFAAHCLMPVSLGFILLSACVITTMIMRSGWRGAFAAFDTIRSFRPAPR